MHLVYLSPVSWESFAQRPHKFVQWFHSRTDGMVLWIDPYPTRFPTWSDLRRPPPSVSRGQSSARPAWLSVLKPTCVPIEPLPGSGWVNGRLWHRQVHQIADFVVPSYTWLAIGKPSVLALELLNFLHHCPSLYDAMDEFPAFYSGLSRVALARRERKIAERVDVISASSSALKSQWERLHKDVRLVHNGLDLHAMRSIERKPASSDTIVFGYVGTIASWFDWTWVIALAKCRPNDEIRLIGPVFEKPNGELPSNITLLPACDHATALEEMARFQVGLIPFKKCSITDSVDPIKYYEYRALGFAVLSTCFGEMNSHSLDHGVFITKSEHDIAHVAELASHFEDRPSAIHTFRQMNNWEARFDAAGFLPKS
jgi:hypothetical protein